MTLDAPTYFVHLRAYVNDRYVMHDGIGGEVVLREKYFPHRLQRGPRLVSYGFCCLGQVSPSSSTMISCSRARGRANRLYSTFSTTMRNLGRNAAIS